MRAIFSLPPSKSMPGGFYWQGDTNDSQFIDVYEFHQNILRSNINGSSGLAVHIEAPVVEVYACIADYFPNGGPVPTIRKGDRLKRMGWKDSRFLSLLDPNIALYEYTIQNFPTCFQAIGITTEVKNAGI